MIKKNRVAIITETAIDITYVSQQDANRVTLRDEVLKASNNPGLKTCLEWILIHELATFKDCQRIDLATAQLATEQLFNIPSSSGLI